MKTQVNLCNLLAKELSKEGSQHQKEEVENDQTVQSLSHHGLPTLQGNIFDGIYDRTCAAF